jgi:hypothetical protein
VAFCFLPVVNITNTNNNTNIIINAGCTGTPIKKKSSFDNPKFLYYWDTFLGVENPNNLQYLVFREKVANVYVVNLGRTMYLSESLQNFEQLIRLG